LYLKIADLIQIKKSMRKLSIYFVVTALLILNEAMGQWNTSGSNIYNTNTGFVAIGNSTPSTLLYVGKNMTEPTITVRNLGGTGGASFRMWDNASGADWKFKATNSGGFKIRDNSNGLDVFTIESNSFANAICIKGGGNVGIGTATPAVSAAVDISSTDKGFLPPRLTQAQIGAIPGPANGLIVYCTSDDKFYAFVASANEWKEILFGSGTISPPSSCGISITINHVAGSVAPVTKTVTYGTVTNIPGEPTKCWITSNLGANHQATAANDATEESAGWYWQFNRMQGYKHTGSARTPNTTWINSIDENSEWLIDNDPCTLLIGIGWRLPTSTELTNVDASENWTDWSGPWDSALKMHASGFLNQSSGSLGSRGSHGGYWSSSQSNNIDSWHLHFTSTTCGIYDDHKTFGFSSRCIRDF
jgi:hypothetical protein